MKKYCFITLMCMFCFHAFGWQTIGVFGERVHFSVLYGNPVSNGVPTPKSPIECPTVSIKDYTLFLVRVDYDLTLQLVDEDGDVVYSVFVPADTPSVVLPSTFVGDYELQLVPTFSNYYFVSHITL